MSRASARRTPPAIPPVTAPVSEPKPGRTRRGDPLLLEVAWEVCNQLGGIYTVLRSKVPSMVNRWGTRYFLIGPYNPTSAQVEFEQLTPSGAIAQAISELRDAGIGASYGKWLVTGRPHVVLIHYLDVFSRLHEVKYKLWNDHGISLPPDDEWLNNTAAFAEGVRIFLSALTRKESPRRPVLAHFHEWMAGAAIPMLRKENWPGSIVFTTHATLLGRYLAMNDDQFYSRLPFYDPYQEAARFNIDPQFRIERAAAHGAQVFTTVSDVTAQECRHLLGRSPDVLLPNGLNIQRFAALHEFQNLHRTYKEKIHNFTIGHFFPSYHFDLDKTLYFYTSGRYEYRNKGMDLTIEALARLNHRLRIAGTGQTVVCFIITRRPVRSINVTALQSSAMLDEIRTSTDALAEAMKEKLFTSVSEGKIPDLNSLVDEYWLLRLRRTMHAWKRDAPPGIVTHDLLDDQNDEVLNQLRACHLWNQSHDPVKVIYHPDFITAANPLFGMDYDQFVRGCHLGVFPSYYEPWGYTPLESIALGVPAITSDLSGFGSYVLQMMPEQNDTGMCVLRRHERSFDQAANDLADRMFAFTQLNRRERIELRNGVESCSEHFDWHNLGQRYNEAHELALDRLGE
jgi:glycogen(starch) synthase